MTSYCLNPNLALTLWAAVALESIITLIANFDFFCLSASSHLCFLWSEWYFIVISSRILWSNSSSVFFSFNHDIPSLSAILSYYFFHPFLCIYEPPLYSGFHRRFMIFFISSSISLYSASTLFTERNSSWLIYFCLFDSFSDCTSFYSFCRTRNTYRNTN